MSPEATMRSRFEMSVDDHLGEDEEPPLEPSPWRPWLFTALMLTFAACSAALLVQ
jgi:hypothetical protein